MNVDDINSIKTMTGLNHVVTFLKGEYQMNPRLGILTLSPLKDLRIPGESIEQSMRSISIVLPRLKLLESHDLLGKLHRGVLSSLEGKCFANLRIQLYNNKKSEKLDADRRERFGENILACDDDSVVSDLKILKQILYPMVVHLMKPLRTSNSLLIFWYLKM